MQTLIQDLLAYSRVGTQGVAFEPTDCGAVLERVLAELKDDSELLSIPVVVMTTSEAEGDILNSYYLHANAYVTKPVDLDCFVDVVSKIEGFWLTVVKLPPD